MTNYTTKNKNNDTMNPSTKTTTLAALAGLALAAGSAQAVVLYQDDFGDGLSDLHGRTPDTTTGGNTWTASTDWKNDGAAAATGAANDDDNAFLDFTPTAGTIYTLTASLATPSGGVNDTSWGGIGFTDTNTLTNAFWENAASPWVLYRENTQVVSFDGPGTSGTNVGEGNFTGPVTLSIVLDTTNALDWTAQWLVNGSEVRAAESIGTPTINSVGLGRVGGAAVDFSSFSLSDNTAIPEPSTSALIGLGGLALILRRRK